CGLVGTGEVYCWGQNDYGQLGIGSTGGADLLRPSTPLDTTGITGDKSFIKITAGEDHTCGLTADGMGYCWGRNNFFQIGDNSSTTRPSPTALDTTRLPAGQKRIIDIDTFTTHSCLINSAGKIFCWGRNQLGQLGLGDS